MVPVDHTRRNGGPVEMAGSAWWLGAAAHAGGDSVGGAEAGLMVASCLALSYAVDIFPVGQAFP